MRIVAPHTIITLLVTDQDEALDFYTQKLGLEKRIDSVFAPGLRLLTVAPVGQHKPEIALAKLDLVRYGEEHAREVMQRSRYLAPWIFTTDNCRAEYEQLRARGVCFVREPTKQLYGLEALFTDLYGNSFSLLEASPEARTFLARHSLGSAA